MYIGFRKILFFLSMSWWKHITYLFFLLKKEIELKNYNQILK